MLSMLKHRWLGVITKDTTRKLPPYARKEICIFSLLLSLLWLFLLFFCLITIIKIIKC